MALQKKISDEELELLIVLTDPIFLTEFLNNTNYGDPNRKNWRKQEPFKLRPYQREIITDTSRNIVVTGGRSIGKCQPHYARLFTNEGYKAITELKDKRHFTVYGISKNNELKMRRAMILPDDKKPVYSLKTKYGYTTDGTDNHPVLTDKGYLLLRDIKPGDRVAVTRKLPSDHCYLSTFEWHEIRVIAYQIFRDRFHAEMNIYPRFKAIEEELYFLADKLYCRAKKHGDGMISFERYRGVYNHPINYLKKEIGLRKGYNTIEDFFNLGFLKNQKIELIQAFIEAAFAQHAELSRTRISLKIRQKFLIKDMQELLLYFGVESRINNGELIIDLPDSLFIFWKTFQLPGVAVDELKTPPVTFDYINEYLRWDVVEEIKISEGKWQTYSVHVYRDETYLSDGIVNHNSVIIENKLLYEIVNSDRLFRETFEQLLATPNQNQLTPLLDKVTNKFKASPLLKDFVEAQNLSKGTFDFKAVGGKVHRLFARIAGSKNENNIVGLHIEKIAVDEAQLFSQGNFNQLGPTLNQWIDSSQQMYSGVHNGIRNMTLYYLDQRSNFKKYRIPSPNNPYFTYEDYIESIKRYGGEDTDLFLQLVLAQPGSAAFSVINRDSMIIAPHDFYSYRYTSADKAKGKTYKETLLIPALPKDTFDQTMLAIDMGFVDPTIIQLFGRDKGRWRVFVRWKVQRIEFPEQEEIIDYIATKYNVSRIAIDIGAGGGGAGVVQSLISRAEYRGKNYEKRISGVNFGDQVTVGADQQGEVLTVPVKTFGAQQIAEMVELGLLHFSELDADGINQIERIAKQKTPSGYDKYFIVSDRGTGASNDDHIFASYICFVMGLQVQDVTPVKKLGRASSGTTNK